ncbi:MAG: dodecin domain-containing protein, partial [bacterium]|nr:dodecin domain-containing protein [bacterium]MCP4308955.1 dodecin domain-containing protein [bacterium]
QVAVTNAAKTVRNIKSITVVNQQATVGADGKINNYRINAKISFALD